MTKQERIQEVYGEHYGMCAPDANGFFDMYKLSLFDFPETLDLIFNPYNGMHRPKSLQGIENNNGWIKIESESDLPNKGVDCYILMPDGKILISIDLDDLAYLTLKNRATHYQPIEKPKPPIY